MKVCYVAKKWGHEEIIVNRPLYCLKRLTVVPNGNACSIHFHKVKTETFVIERGCLFLRLYNPIRTMNDKPELKQVYELTEGAPITIEPFIPHQFYSTTGVCSFLEVSTHDDPADSYRLTESGPI